MATPYNCLIVDDETLAQELLTAHIAKVPEFNLVGCCHTAIEARATLEREPIDILFLDIQMPNLTGIDFLKTLSHPPLTVFTTAYSEFALESYELNALDYLLKPITFTRFFKTVNKLLERLQPKEVTSAQEQPTQQLDYLFVKSDFKAIKVKFEDILYVESLQKYVRFIMPGSKVMTLMSLTKLEGILPSPQFMRVHKSYIVNLSKITGIEGNRLHIGDHTINISKTIKPALLKELDHYGLL